MQNIVLTGMQVTSVFIPTAIAALWFPYSKRAKGVWDSSPYKKWTFLGLPVVVWGAAVDLVYLGILLYYFIFNSAAKQFTGPSVILFVGVWVRASSGTSPGVPTTRRSPAWTSRPSPTASCLRSDLTVGVGGGSPAPAPHFCSRGA